MFAFLRFFSLYSSLSEQEPMHWMSRRTCVKSCIAAWNSRSVTLESSFFVLAMLRLYIELKKKSKLSNWSETPIGMTSILNGIGAGFDCLPADPLMKCSFLTFSLASC